MLDVIRVRTESVRTKDSSRGDAQSVGNTTKNRSVEIIEEHPHTGVLLVITEKALGLCHKL